MAFARKKRKMTKSRVNVYIYILHASDGMKRFFVEAPLVSFWRPKNLKGELVRSRVQRSVGEGMKRCGKSRCQIYKFVKEGRSFHNNLGNREFYVNYDFYCDSKDIVYLIKIRYNTLEASHVV